MAKKTRELDIVTKRVMIDHEASILSIQMLYPNSPNANFSGCLGISSAYALGLGHNQGD